MNGQIETRADAEKELKAMIRRDKRAGGVLGQSAVTFRRDNAIRMAATAHMWAAKGEKETALRVMKSARAQAIIARGLARYLSK